MLKPLAPPPIPPGTWTPARKAARLLLRPLEAFLHVQAASGLLLLLAAVVALAWANSPWHTSYESFWHTPLMIGVGPFVTTKPLHFFINDGLMVIFFFVVGLEIRREMAHGELSEPRRAALPAAAALGGMLVPAGIYLLLNAGSPAKSGWGVPMATDIAFAVGVLSLLGKRVPAALRVLLLALAIIDDIGAIIVIALFYSSQFNVYGLGIVAVGTVFVLLFQALGVRRPFLYVLPGLVIWVGFLVTGIHPTIAGVMLGLLTPVRPWFGQEGFVAVTERALEKVRNQAAEGHDAHALLEPLAEIAEARREAVAPVVRIEAVLNPWVAYGIMPLFALANAGVHIGGTDLSDPTALRLGLGVSLGLVLGKPIGVLLASFLAVRVGIASLPRGISWKNLSLVGGVAGIGFTMAIFIAGLAFPDNGKLAVAKLAVLVGTTIAAVVSLALGRFLLPATSIPGTAETVDDAEQSTES